MIIVSLYGRPSVGAPLYCDSASELTGTPTDARTGCQVSDLNIEDWRDEIDRLDEQLVKLLNARSQCAIELGRIKRELGLAVYSPDREREVIAHVTGINPGPLGRDAVRRLFERIIDESRSIERVTIEKETRNGKRKRRHKG